MSYSLNWSGNNINLKFFGLVNFHDLREANGLIYGDKRFDNMKYQIADFSEIDNIQISLSELTLVSLLDKTATQWKPSVKVACISNDVKTDTLIEQYIQVMNTTTWKCKLFHNIQDAKQWCED